MRRELALVVVFVASWAAAQSTTGLPPFSTIDPSAYDDVKINDGAILLKLRVRDKAGVIPFSYFLTLNSTVGLSSSLFVSINSSWSPATSAGLSRAVTANFSGGQTVNCPNGTKTFKQTTFQIVDGFGTVHPVIGMLIDSAKCFTQVTSGTANDQSGYSVTTDSNGLNPQVFDRFGHAINVPTKTLTDANGNQISYTHICNPSNCAPPATQTYTWTDTTGLTPLTETQTISTTALTKEAYTWTDAAGNSQSYTVNYSLYSVKTNFGCYIPEDLAAQTSYLPSTISGPDGTYTLTYEPTPGNSGYVTGRLSKILFPSGASISYAYSGGSNGLTCEAVTATQNPYSPIMVPVLTRTLTDTTGTAHKWTYDTTKIANATVVTDPTGNDTVYTFSTEPVSARIRSFLETQRQIYKGSYTANQLLKTILTCYNGNTSGCASATVTGNVLEKDVYTTLPGMSQSAVSKKKYDRYGNLTEDTEYNYDGSMISDRVLTYGTSSNPNCSSVFKLCSDVTQIGTTVIAQTNYTYDSHSNLLSTSRLVGGSTYLVSSATYNSNGTVNTATDVNGGQTTYSAYACNNNYPSTISEPLGLSRSTNWDCNGGVQTSVTDENGQVTTYNYVNASGVADPLYRPVSSSDPLENTTNYAYTPNTLESAMNFNGSLSTSDTLTTIDGFGHKLLQQQRQAQGSSSFDTTQYTYDAAFRPSTVSIPCVASAGQGCSTAVTTTSYDGLNRVTQVQDGGGGLVTTNYAPGGTFQNDTLVSVLPAVNGENPNGRQKQLEYDALGRLTSLCEVTSAAGNGACAQASATTGYFTKYTYNVDGELTGVTQNAQGTPQTRAYTYDGLWRLTSETNPETGTATAAGTSNYTYDTDSSGQCTGTYNGDLIKIVDPAGNVTCFQYDALHRLTSMSYPSGPNAAPTSTKTFIYDSTTFSCPSGPKVAGNVAGRLAEAYTGTSSAKITDIGYCYSARGELTDVFETTPHSAGTYHSTAAYFANGALQSLGGIPNESGMTYGVDGEGRLTTALHGTSDIVCDSSCSPSSTTYNAAGQPLKISIGGFSDNDTFTYDPNTNRMSTYTFTVGATPASIQGTLTWNKNGSLQQLAITDGFNSGGTQTCKYGDPSATPPVAGYDDAGRLVSTNCGSVWSQSFSYDPFGNITKSGSVSWMPGYNNQNHYTLSGTKYDLDGNLLSDTFNSYTWDTDGHVSTINSSSCGTNGVCLTYDALGQMVEKSSNSNFTEVLYSPAGKTAIMAGQTPLSSYMPLPGGATEFDSNGSAHHFWHKDWLGSGRLSTAVTNRNVIADRAFAPFGEPYAQFGGGNEFSFTGDTQDTIANTYDTPNRELTPTQGRWLTPDPAGLSAVNPSNPQSWNRYAYVNNSPLTLADNLGTACYAVERDEAGDCDIFDSADDFGDDALLNAIAGHNVPCGTDDNPANCWVGDYKGECEVQNGQTLCWNGQAWDAKPQPDGDGWPWWWNFTKSFVSLKGGPSNVPTCAEVTFAEIGDDVVGGFLPSQAAEQGLKAASAAQTARALNYAASRPNYLGGTGLVYANKSSVFRSMLTKAEFLGEAAEALPVLEVGLKDAPKSIGPASHAARTGNCAAAFPVF